MPDNCARDDALELSPLNETELETLAPNYIEADHARYVQHIMHGLSEPKNRNIALTGPYGSGKSSILDHVVKKLDGTEPSTPSVKPSKVIRISIGTLGPEIGDQDTTNRIQKELVKQLLYQVKPGTVRHSRFPRAASVPWLRVVSESAAFAVLTVGLLWMFGLRPDLSSPGTDLPWFAAPLVLTLLVAGAFGVARRYLGTRTIAQVAAGGASISFDKRTDSVFDKYLDEIVVFFETTRTDVVVFEDLDRFGDPEIFDSLRSLNTLINESTTMREAGRTLHFVFAIKDSLFEKLDASPAADDDKDAAEESDERKTGERDRKSVPESDAAQEEVDRANRTKFFELVVPVVPFLSASNARDLLEDRFKKLQVPGEAVSRRLIDLIARHTTDMRLLVNIRNEFVVFAQRLLLAGHQAPGITADAVFALVAYKNFHMSDYEQIFHRNSKLDELEQIRRAIVTTSIRKMQERRADLATRSLLWQQQAKTAAMLGNRLAAWLDSLPNDMTLSGVSVGGDSIAGQYDEVATWRAVSKAKRLDIQCGHGCGRPIKIALVEANIRTLFPEAFEADRWIEIDDAALAPERDEIDKKIADLRGADFRWLHEHPDYQYEDLNFAAQAEAKLESDLARELVAAGYLNRYFAEYVSVFYGKFTGVAVANFFRNCVWPNEMDVQFQLSVDDADNVLEQAPAGFSSSRSALNINLVNRLLVLSQQVTTMDTGLDAPTNLLDEIVAFTTGPAGAEGLDFLKQFFADTSAERTALLGRLATQHWDLLLEHVTDPSIVDDERDRIKLFDHALLIGADSTFELGSRVFDMVEHHHDQITAFTKPNGDSDRIYPFLRRTGLVVPDLRALSPELQEPIIEDGAYELTASNLRTALGIGEDVPPTLERIREHDAVWKRCTVDLETYLDVMDDEGIGIAVYGPDTLSELIAAIAQGDETHAEPGASSLGRLLLVSAHDSALPDITEVPSWTWDSLVKAQRMQPTVDNLLEYLEHQPSGSPELNSFLASVRQIEAAVPSDAGAADGQNSATAKKQERLAVLLLNLSIPDRARSIEFARQLVAVGDLTERVEDLDTGSTDLLPGLLGAKLIDDSREVFAHFLGGGWSAVARAVLISANFPVFLDPELIDGMTGDLLGDAKVNEAIKRKVLDDLDVYVPGDPENLLLVPETLKAALGVAAASQYLLPATQLERIARAGGDHELLLQQLASNSELAAEDLLGVLSEMGGEFEGFATQSTEPFEIRSNANLTSVLQRMKKGVAVHHETVPKKRRRKVWFGN